MIKAKISQEYPSHIAKCKYSDQTLYIADYTQQTRICSIKRGVEIFENIPPTDIHYFELENKVHLSNGYISFDNTSFTSSNGSALSQCECVIFPKISTANTWILFVELKYSYKPKNNNDNLKRAINQLYKTRIYYLHKGIFSKTNTCYLLASLPMQVEPFAQTIISQMDLIRLKRKHNVVLRLQNHAEIQNDKLIKV